MKPTQNFIRLINSVLREHHIETLLTNNYGGLLSREYVNFLKEKDIDNFYTAVNNAASNGINERLNQTLVNRIRRRVYESKGKSACYTITHRCMKTYNDTIYSSTRFSPNYLMYGISDFSLPLSSSCESNFFSAFQNSMKSHLANKYRIDRNKREADLKVKNMVHIENENKLNRRS